MGVGSELSKSTIKKKHMYKSTRKTSSTQWMSPLNQTLFEEQLAIHHLYAYTKKLYIASFIKLLFYAHLHQAESLRSISDAVFSDDLQNAIDLKSIRFSQLG